ncbi:MAG: Ig-like domain-containing protein, partial [Oscillospiraceae bacterium]|nr:Ig-like domain-containing protein [Oscillospiraceae bacterium]
TRIAVGSPDNDTSGKTLADVDPAISDPWDFLAVRCMHAGGYTDSGMWYRTEKNVADKGLNGMSFEITVPKDGVYEPTVSFDYAASGCVVSVFIFSKETADNLGLNMTTRSGIITSTQTMTPVGTYDAYNTNAKNVQFDMEGKATLPAVELKEGSNYVVFSMTAVSENATEHPVQPHMEIRSLYIEEVEEEIKVAECTYDFKTYVHNVGISEIVNYDKTKNWKYHSMSESLFEKYRNNYKYARTMSPYGLQLQTSNAEWVALTLDVPAKGKYVVDFVSFRDPTGGLAEIYLSPIAEKEENRMNAKYNLGIVDFSHATDLVYNCMNNLKVIEIDRAGEYVLVMNPIPGGVTNRYNMAPTSMTLTAVEIIGAKLVFDEEYLRIGASEHIDMKITTDIERDIDSTLAGITPSFKSSDEDVVTVSDNGALRGIGVGTATITATADMFGEKLEATVDIIVKDIRYSHAEMNLEDGEAFFVGGEKQLSAEAHFSDNTIAKQEDISIRYESDTPSVAQIENEKLKAVSEGTANITAYVSFCGDEKSITRRVEVKPVRLASISAKTEDTVVSSFDDDGSRIIVTGTNNDGSPADISNAEYTYENLTPDVVSVDEFGYAHYVSRGEGRIKVTANVGGVEFECICEVVPSSQKTEPTIYTYEMREQARENISKYGWAKDIAKTAKNNAERYTENIELMYEIVPTEGVPRGLSIATVDAPATTMAYSCPYCKVDIRKEYGHYKWVVDPIRNPWKIQCPDCKQLFPSNDFELLYKRGLDENGIYNRELAIENNRIAVANGEKDALVNELYKNVDDTLGISPDKVSTWMVDDGFGWSEIDGTYGTTTRPKWSPIAYYAHAVWYSNGNDSFIFDALTALRDAYLYTGEEKYGRAGAILIDRVADVYPGFDLSRFSINYLNSEGGRNNGKIVGSIWETRTAELFVRAYDAFYPMFDDPQVIRFLSEKAEEKGLENPKSTGDMIRENCENGILREVFESAEEGKIWGNFGMHQLTVALCAVALDTQPETNEMLDWLGKESKAATKTAKDEFYGNSFTTFTGNSGGEMLVKYVRDVDRDGFGNEVGIGYNSLWLSNGFDVAEVLYRYGAESDLNLFENPKYVKMLDTFIRETLGNGYSIQLGDSGATASTWLDVLPDETLRAYYLLKDPKLAQNYYFAVNGDLGEIYTDIFTDNDGLKESLESDIEKYGELKLESENLTGFGLAILRGGELIKGTSSGAEQRYDTWMYYGITNQSHAHNDMLQLGIDAYGFNFMPDLGYPEATGYDPNRWQWVKNTLSHNTVSVNGLTQNGTSGGTPIHFDDAGRVKVIDAKADGVYADTSIYRRTAVTVAESAGVAYTVDFFRVKGGDKHTYSFHTQSYMGYTTDDFTLAKQADENGEYVGSYAGADVYYGEDPNTPKPATSDCVTKYPRGYTWLTNVNRAENLTSGSFSVNFEQTDFNKQVSDSKGLNLKFSALNDWTPSELAITTGYAPRTSSNKNIPGLDYMLIHREGKNLDTLFTSVLQPYKGEEYIESMSYVAASVKSGTP